MTIGQLAAAAGVGVETVRYYQRRGLLDTPGRPAGAGARGGVRRYDAVALERLRFIRAGAAAGFTLEEMGELVALDAGQDRARARSIAEARIAALDARIDALRAARDGLSRLWHACAADGAGPCPILAAFSGEGASGARRGP